MSIFRNVNLISVQDWDELVTRVYGKPYKFQQQDGIRGRGVYWQECPVNNPEDYKNDIEDIDLNLSGFKEGVSFKSWLETPESDFRVLRWYRDKYPCIDMIINDLHEKGFIPEGDFGIEIDW